MGDVGVVELAGGELIDWGTGRGGGDPVQVRVQGDGGDEEEASERVQ